MKLLITVLWFSLVTVIRTDIQQDKKNILDDLLDPDVYDPEIKPGSGNNTDTPTTVSINLHVLSVTQIDDLKMLFTIELYFRQEWKDDRLQFDEDENIDVITLHDNHRIWVPNVFFPNEYKSYFHDIMESNNMVKIKQNGTVMSSARVTLTLRCPMHFAKFPFDKHVCPLIIESYKYKADETTLQWSEDPVSITNEVLSPLFNITGYNTQAGLIAMNSGEYTRLILSFHIVRLMKHYIVHVFVPACMIFCVSCMAAWLHPRLMTARLLIGLCSLFSLAMLITNFDQYTPKVPYTRAVDVFTGMCMTFIFSTLIETIFVHLSYSKERDGDSGANEDKDDIEQNEKVVPKKKPMKQMKEWLFDNHETLNDIDAASRVLFPICFVIFIIIYSITCAALKDA